MKQFQVRILDSICHHSHGRFKPPYQHQWCIQCLGTWESIFYTTGAEAENPGAHFARAALTNASLTTTRSGLEWTTIPVSLIITHQCTHGGFTFHSFLPQDDHDSCSWIKHAVLGHPKAFAWTVPNMKGPTLLERMVYRIFYGSSKPLPQTSLSTRSPCNSVNYFCKDVSQDGCAGTAHVPTSPIQSKLYPSDPQHSCLKRAHAG